MAIENARKQGIFATPDYHDPSLVQAAAQENGITLKESEAGMIWEWHSEQSAAGWLGTIDKDTVARALYSFTTDFAPPAQAVRF